MRERVKDKSEGRERRRKEEKKGRQYREKEMEKWRINRKGEKRYIITHKISSHVVFSISV